jgi:hypothetical protein
LLGLLPIDIVFPNRAGVRGLAFDAFHRLSSFRMVAVCQGLSLVGVDMRCRRGKYRE